MTVCAEVCGRFTIVGEPASLGCASDGAVAVQADRDYVVQLPPDVAVLPLAGALRRLPGAHEAVLRFSGFIGDTELDGRRLRVSSPKLLASEVEQMLSEISERLAALPFGFATPTKGSFSRDAASAPDVAYQAAVLILNALSRGGPHDLTGALSRIADNPYTVLRSERASVPLPLADRLTPSSLVDVMTGATLSDPMPADHPLAATPVAIALGGRVPEFVSVERVRSDLDNLENRFVVAVLDACLMTIDAVRNLARESKAPGATALERDCASAHEVLTVWRRHRTFDGLDPAGAAPLNSTVLQRQAGYRHILSFWMDLIGRTRWLPRASALLALRDAPTLYEYWCYFKVVEVVEEHIGPAVSVDGPAQDDTGVHLKWSSRARFASGVAVVFNERFGGRTSVGSGPKSSSVPLRPDIVLRPSSGVFHVLDAKFRRAGVLADLADEPAESSEDAAKQADVHKMHAYRDALGCQSAWVLYPGTGPIREFASHGMVLSANAAPAGVGTVPLRPSGDAADGLRGVIERML